LTLRWRLSWSEPLRSSFGDPSSEMSMSSLDLRPGAAFWSKLPE
jgi:hypothetical protein